MNLTSKESQEKILYSCQWLLVGLFFVYSIAFVEHSIGVTVFPWAVDYGEMPEVARAWSLYNGETIYTPWDSLPLRVSNYPPVYSFLNSLFIGITGPTPLLGRCISVFATLGIAFVLLQLVFRITKSLPLGILGGALYLSGHMVWGWGSLYRVDNLALLFQVMALQFGFLYLLKKQKHFMWLTIIFCLFAGFTRQTMLAAFFAVFFTLLRNQWRDALNVLFIYATLGFTGLFCLLWITDFNAWNHLFVSNVNEFGIEMMTLYFGPVWSLYHWLIPGILVGLWKVRNHRLIVFYWMFAACSSLLSGKVGSSVNYLLELWFASCLLAVVSLQKVQTRKPIVELTLVLLFVVGWQQIFHVPHRSEKLNTKIVMGESKSFWRSLVSLQKKIPLWKLNPLGFDPTEKYRNYFVSYPSKLNADFMHLTESNLMGIKKPIFSEDMNFTLSLGHQIMVQPFEITQMAKQKVMEPTAWYDCLEKRCFGALVFTFPLHDVPQKGSLGWHITPKSLQLMRTNYKPYKKIGGYWTYLPKEE